MASDSAKAVIADRPCQHLWLGWFSKETEEDAMLGRTEGTARSDDLVAIARGASLYDWLMALTRSRTRPQPLPGALHADLGLPPPRPDRCWQNWR
jgi:hypothetical protein